MVLFSKVFGRLASKTKSAAINTSFLQTYSGGSGGWGLDRFNSIIKAHSSVEGIIDEFQIDKEGSPYDCYAQAYSEEYAKAQITAEVLRGLGEIVAPDTLIDQEEVQEKARQYAIELVERWLNGTEWIPEEIMDWAWYVLSDHNK